MTESRLKNWMTCAALAAWLLLPAGPLLAQTGQAATHPLIDWPVEVDPALVEAQQPTRYHPRQASVWMQALNQPDAQTRYQTALAIHRAHREGMPGLQIALHRLSTIVAAEDEHPLTRIAAAQAIITLDGQDHAAILWSASQALGPEMARIASPALARWKHEPALQTWRKTLADASETLTSRRLAAEALALAGDAPSAPALHALALDSQAGASLRLAAAQAYAEVVPSNGPLPALPSAHRQVGNIDTLVRAHLLGAHQNPDAHRQLAELLTHADPAVVMIAGQSLAAHAPDRLDAHLPALAKSGDAGHRRIAITRWSALSSPSAIAGLVELLEDPQPLLRQQAGAGLIALGSNAQLLPAVKQAVLKAIESGKPAGQEQAALVAGELRLVEAGPLLVKLLDHASPEAGLAGATSLRKLQLPDTLSAALENIVKNTAKSAPANRDGQAAQLIQLMGLTRHQPAEPVLRKLVPKASGPLRSRQAAVWALGYLHEGNADARLVTQLMGRINDTQGMEPEDEEVRKQAIIAIGRMKGRGGQALLTKLASDLESSPGINAAARWAIGQLTGTQPPMPELPVQTITGGFLAPID